VAWSLVGDWFSVVAFARRGRVTCHEASTAESDMQACLSDLHSILSSLSAKAKGTLLMLYPLDGKLVWLWDRMPVESCWRMELLRNGLIPG